MSLQLYVIAGVIVLLFLAVLFIASRRRISSSGEISTPQKNVVPQKGLFVDIGPETKELLLEDWRWKVGNDAKVIQATVFGDLFTQTSKGKIYWLDTGKGRYVEVAENAEKWAQAIKNHGQEWFHWNTFRDLRSLGVELKEGQVYSWRHSPMLGGIESVDNVDFVSLEVHVSHAGQVAESIKDVPWGTKIEKFNFEVLGPQEADDTRMTADGDEDVAIYEVIIDEEMQYSIWPAGQKIPAGWKSAGKSGKQQECLDYIKEVWTDMRPLSLRTKLEGR